MIIFQAFATSSIVGKLVVFVLMAFSVWGLGVWLAKLASLKTMYMKGVMVVRNYRNYTHPMGYLLKGYKREVGVCQGVIYSRVIEQFLLIMKAKGITEEQMGNWDMCTNLPKLSDTEFSLIQSVAEQTLSEQLLLIEDDMSKVALCVSVPPSLGLFGTVWGVMESFMQMGAGGGAALISAVAPGISGALLTTICGLLISIAGSFGYNDLAARVQRLTVLCENFTDEILSDISRAHRISHNNESNGML